MSRLALLACAAIVVVACDKKVDPQGSTASSASATVTTPALGEDIATEADFEGEAEDEITEANFESELDKLEKEIQ